MKAILVLLLGIITLGLNPLFAQEREKSTTELKAELAALQSRLNDQKAEEQKFTSQFTGFGKELGTALNGFVEAMDGGMKVTTNRANEFAQTDVGKYAIIAIGWKIFATDIIGIVRSAFNKFVGFVFLFVFCWLLKRTIETLCWGRMIVTKREGPWYARQITKERTKPLIDNTDGDEDYKIGFLVISCIALVVVLICACVGLCN